MEHSEHLKRILNKKHKLTQTLEVIYDELGSTNKALSCALAKEYESKIIQFDRDNQVLYVDMEKNVYKGVSPEEKFAVIEIRSANTFHDISFVIKGLESGKCILIPSGELHSYKAF